MRLATIGVYGATQQRFLAALHREGVRTVVDVRQRRGVRGPEYSWANSRRLQDALAAADVGYVHRRDLAPTTALRQLQYRADALAGVGKRNRLRLAPGYIEGYLTAILDHADLRDLYELDHPALLCVERDAAACHRSLIAERLARNGATVRHLLP